MSRRTTRAQAIKMFRESIAPLIRAKFGRGDAVAMREAWNDWTDALIKDGELPSSAYDWSNPF